MAIGLYWAGSPLSTAANGCRFSWEKTGVRNTANLIVSYQYTVNVSNGMITGVNGADVRAKMAALEAGVSGATGAAQGNDLVYYLDDGSVSANSVLAANCLEGPYLDQLVWTDEPGAQYVTHKKFACRFTFVRSILTTLQQGAVLTDFTETVSVSGGVAQFVIQSYLNAPPDRVNTVYQTPVTIVQSGSATGFMFKPSPPAALFPGDLVEAATTFDGGHRRGNNLMDRTRTWNYVMRRVTMPADAIYLWTTGDASMPTTPGA